MTQAPLRRTQDTRQRPQLHRAFDQLLVCKGSQIVVISCMIYLTLTLLVQATYWQPLPATWLISTLVGSSNLANSATLVNAVHLGWQA